ncbi:class I SAM-dependent methyltransferase [Ktedonosporobacter rubrisoli]|uniref:Class I SAM-dependent methyltransferase n=1 Tax=Ktedonosporobacter rubrisoli TaxID=2509675 RepID=A0A4P6JJX8_KTERU|nr:class I SAM-dependent methyltransferase [Ktedonosporobacter rubrisoli]QBD74936.1 class I SAM-dependent methyltransferase [Ktedonosporobacter rubrisoli]
MTSISFDPLAQAYDAMRGYPENVSQQLAQAIDQAARGNAQTRFLEVGVGSGRVALPLIELGRQYTGVDISENMLTRLVQKLQAAGWQEMSTPWGSEIDEQAEQQPKVLRFVHERKHTRTRVIKADMTALPFQDASFDVVIASHVFHFVSAWQKALQEVVRVLRPGGMLIRCWNENWQQCWEPGSGEIRREWSKIVKHLGGSVRFVGAAEQSVTAWLQTQGLATEQWEILSWQRPVTARSLVESLMHYQRAGAWSLPDDLFEASLEPLQLWVHERYGARIDEVFPQDEHLLIGRTVLPAQR